MTGPILELKNIRKNFGDTEVLNGISLSIEKGEFLTLLGPSGCGKTTTLRIIAGLEVPESGQVLLEGKDVTDLPPDRRDVNTVFQNYALFPHMNVAANIGYSLKLRRKPAREIRRAVAEALATVQLEGYEKRMPGELSGGQKQRVAIARAIVSHPSVLLLDEPLGALDLQLRRKMQWELKQLQKQLGITFIYITHDQEEALNMSDRIAVMKDGQIQQLGTPEQIYETPRTSYVAGFVGEANILKGTVKETQKDRLILSVSGGCGQVRCPDRSFSPGTPVILAVRSENVEFTEDLHGCGLRAEVTARHFAGGLLRIELTLEDGTTLIASRHGINLPVELHQQVIVFWKPETAVLVDLEDSL